MNLSLIPSPFALDQHLSGMGRAPQALLDAGLAAALKRDGHTVTVVDRELDLGAGTVLQRIGRNCAILAEAVAEARRANTLPVILGGDCLVSIGAVAGLQRAPGGDFGVAWFDAHADFNTPETTLSGYLGGMPLACCCGRGLERLRQAAGLGRPVPEAQVILLGARDLDPPERLLLDSTPVRILSPLEVPSLTADARPTYLHFDIDVMDPPLAPGVNFLTPHGLSLETAASSVKKIQPHLATFSLTAVDPEHDRAGRTVKTAIEIVRAALS